MFDAVHASPGHTQFSNRLAHHGGHERRAEGDALLSCLKRMLDEVDYGMLLVDHDAQVLHLNHAARLELDREHPLQMLGQTLRAHRAQDVAPLYDALAAAQRGLRQLLPLGDPAQGVNVSVLPLPAATGRRGEDGGNATLIVLGKRQVCQQLSVQGYARSVGLTPAETRVLELLCAGVRPTQLALKHGIALSTVRTQISSIRTKTGACSIGALLHKLAALPPLRCALRGESAPLAC